VSRITDIIRRFVANYFKPMTKKHVAICVGHSRAGDNGAANVFGVYEWHFNKPLADRVAELIRDSGHLASVVGHYNGNSYGSAMTDAAKQVKMLCADATLELHFNAAGSTSATGFEFLCWHSSKRSGDLATSMQKAFQKAFPDQRNRGVKLNTPADRGSGFLQKTHCPAVICEPFFGSNPHDTAFFNTHREELACAYADGILNWLST
jgi:N-acetylmuramoyl-L-alanine amidase